MDNKLVMWIKKDRRSMEQIEYDRLIHELAMTDPNSDEYRELIQSISTISRLRKESKKDIPWGAILGFAGTTLACVCSVYQMSRVTQFENAGEIVTSKWFQKIPLPNVFK
jgi:hypothetical protein